MRNANEIGGFHFHIYYSNESRKKAEDIFKCFPNAHWYDKPVGPHTQPMFLIEVALLRMEEVYKFMILNRNGLSVLIHPLTVNELEDHTTSAGWLGDKVPLDLDKL